MTETPQDQQQAAGQNDPAPDPAAAPAFHSTTSHGTSAYAHALDLQDDADEALMVAAGYTIYESTAGQAAAVEITGVTAGTPGSFAPVGFTPLADLNALKANGAVGDSGTAKPTTAWTTGQHVLLGDGSKAYWNGTAWVAGQAA